MALAQRLVSARLPYLPIVIRVRIQTLHLEALIDTGFEGDVVVPAATFSGEPADAYLPYRLADGSSHVFDAYLGTVELAGLGQFSVVTIALGNECLIGRGVTDRLRLTLNRGQQVIAEYP